MTDIPDNPPAFPEVPGDFNEYEGRPGMTLRDWFAGQALAGLSTGAANYVPDEAERTLAAQVAYRLADAMLAERSQ